MGDAGRACTRICGISQGHTCPRVWAGLPVLELSVTVPGVWRRDQADGSEVGGRGGFVGRS